MWFRDFQFRDFQFKREVAFFIYLFRTEIAFFDLDYRKFFVLGLGGEGKEWKKKTLDSKGEGEKQKLWVQKIGRIIKKRKMK